MANPRYFQDELEKRFEHLAEECAEFLAAYSKMKRWGAFSCNPELEPSQQEPNIAWVHREIKDIDNAMERVVDKLRNIGFYELDVTKCQPVLNEAFPLYND